MTHRSFRALERVESWLRILSAVEELSLRILGPSFGDTDHTNINYLLYPNRWWTILERENDIENDFAVVPRSDRLD